MLALTPMPTLAVGFVQLWRAVLDTDDAHRKPR
jgi:hypothetical protein